MASPVNSRITFISAGAGSGKTHRLTQILHQELTGQCIRPSGVIATTFTRRAAAELRERVRAHLLEQGSFALANSIGLARIGTVNSVCGQLIERFAFEAGLPADQLVLEEAAAATLLSKAIDVVMDGAEMSTFLTVARRLGLEEDWKGALQTLVKLIRSNDIPADEVPSFALANAEELLAHFPSPTREDLSAGLAHAIRVALPEIELRAAEGGKKNTNEYLALLRMVDRGLANDATTWGEWLKLSKLLPEARLKVLVEPIADIAGRAAEHKKLHADVREYLAQIFDLAARVLTVYAESKRELGVLDFTDQEHRLLGLLEDPVVAETLGDELDLLMVDEFQDTSPIQLALFLKLAQFAKRIYWVGDIKQAIYGFRGSDTELMQSILDQLPVLGGCKEVLTASWRSRPDLVRLVNAVFGHAFASCMAKKEVELQHIRSDQLPGAPIMNWILGGENVTQEASALAGGIRKLLESRYQVNQKGTAASRDVRLGDIAVLARSNTRVDTLAAEFHAMGIPCATAQPGLLATPEATLALACLRRLNDPGDTIATAEIVSLADCLEPEDWVVDRLRYLATGAKDERWMEVDIDGHQAHPLIVRIARLREQLPVLAPREALQTVISACEVPSVIVKWSADAERARMRLANVEALLELAMQYEELCRGGQHAASISGLILWLGETAADETDMLAEPAIDAVKVMTHHAAKGLEWPVVILMDLGAAIKDRLWSISAQPGSGFDVQNPLKDRRLRYWPWPFGAQKKVAQADTIALTPTAKQFRAVAIEEEKRLLYVSMTRARDLLILARSSRKLSGEWLDCVEAPWLLPDEGANTLTLPTGEKLSAEHWSLEPDGIQERPGERATRPMHWFASSASATRRLPLIMNPSSADEIAAVALETCRVGERIPVSAGADMTVLGTAIHACLALSFTDPKRPLRHGEVDELLRGFGVSDWVASAAVLRQAQALHDWISTRWPQATALAEYPVQSVLETGQVLNGRLDLLIDTRDGWVIVDHKSSPLGAERWTSLAKDHGAQITAYSRAVAKASGRPVSESWLFLPVAAGAIRIGSAA